MRLVPSLIVAASLAGCSATVPVKEVVSNPGAYLPQFAVVSPETLKRLPKGEPELAFRRIETEMAWDETRSDSKDTRDVTATGVLVNGGGGLVQSYTTVSNNGVPFRINYRVTYRGVTALKWQTVFLNLANAEAASEVKNIKTFEPLPSVGGTTEYAFNFGTTAQVANYTDRREKCTAGASKPAKDLHTSLDGNSTELTCEYYGSNGQMLGKSAFAILSKYGVAIQTGYTDSTLKSTYRFKSIRIS